MDHNINCLELTPFLCQFKLAEYEASCIFVFSKVILSNTCTVNKGKSATK